MTDAERNKRLLAATKAVLKQRTLIQRQTQAEIVGLLKEALARIQATLAAAPTDYQLWSLPQLEREIRLALAETERAASGTLRTAAGQAWEAGRQSVIAPIEAGGISLSGMMPAINVRQLNAISTFMVKRMKDVTDEMAGKITSELGMVVIGAQGPHDAIKKITGIVGESSRATTIVRTEIGRTFSVAANESQTDAAKVLPGLKKRWIKSGKINSRPEHDAADGQIVAVDEPFTLGNGVQIMFPLDPAAPPEETINCGCVSVSHMDSWE